ncbi:translation initiation factor IF-2 [Striga asiatica]|uniref:Translation initiation factor IF-2 n=1 Tax=Striga asiatica TaxID=4170 RepID=A0A5A7R6D5_STRAF|nr:translation initiation factor IF-2 [Striga asiatica]
MEPGLDCQPDTELGHASKHPSIASVQMRVPCEARIEHPSQNPSKGCANGVPSAPKRHIKIEFFILLVALRATPNVVPPIVVVFGQNPHKILGEKQGVVVSEDVPVDSGHIEGDGVPDDARDAEAGGEGRGAGRDDDRGEGVGRIGGGAVQEEEGGVEVGDGAAPEADSGGAREDKEEEGSAAEKAAVGGWLRWWRERRRAAERRAERRRRKSLSRDRVAAKGLGIRAIFFSFFLLHRVLESETVSGGYMGNI